MSGVLMPARISCFGGENSFQRRYARDASNQLREPFTAQQVPHLAMRSGDGKPNTLTLQYRVQLP